MNTKSFLLILLLLTIRAISQEISNIPDFERQGNAKKFIKPLTLASNNYNVHYYKCEWTVNPAKNHITGKVTPHFIVTAATNSLVFDLSHALKVDSVYMRGTKLMFSQSTNETLVIQLPKIYAAGAKDSLTIAYKGVPNGNGFGSFVQTTHNGTPVIWTLSEPYGAKDWWPCRNGLDDKADSIDIYITSPSRYKASSNGALQSVVKNGRNSTTFYKHRYPVASYLVAIAVTDFSTFTDYVQLGNKTLPVISYIYPEDSAWFHDSTYKVLNAMQLYNDKFTPYPFVNERYGQTEFGFGGGMEHQTNSFVTYPGENVMTHELAHQWFGDKITCGSWTDVWLNEGFATFCADFLYTETFNPPQYKLNVTNDLADIVSKPDGSVKVDDTTNLGRIFDGRLSYHKGAFLLRMLRWTLGSDAFFKGIRNYLKDPLLQYSFARTPDLQRNLEEVSGLDLDYFFNQWYAGQGYPSFTVQWSQDANNRATITITQTTSHSSVKFFRVPLQLTFKRGSQEKTIVVDNTINNQVLTADVGFKASKLLIDPNQYLISKNNKAVYVEAPKEFVTVSPNPFTDKIEITLHQNYPDKILLQLFNSNGDLVASSNPESVKGTQKYTLKVPIDLAAGTYILHMTIDGKTITKNVVK